MKNIRVFYVLYVLFLAVLLTLILRNEKSDLHLMLSSGFCSFLTPKQLWLSDVFFKYITEVGSMLPIIVGVLFLLFRFGSSFFILISQLAVALVVYVVKVMVNAPRPKLFFQEFFPDVVLRQVEGVSLHSSFSFPSGHTAAAFSFMLCLSILTNRRWTSVVYFCLAVLVGYSRIYLSQHFAMDVFVGSIVGVVVTSVVFYFHSQNTYVWQKESLLLIFKKKIKNGKR